MFFLGQLERPIDSSVEIRSSIKGGNWDALKESRKKATHSRIF